MSDSDSSVETIQSQVSPLKNSDLLDYSHHFRRNELFESRKALVDWAKQTSLNHNMYLIIQTSKHNKVHLTCERYGKPRPLLRNIPSKSRRVGSKKNECPFKLIGRMEREGAWSLSISDGHHHHPPPTYKHGHGKVSRLSEEQHAHVKELTKAHIKPKQILNILQEKNSEYKGSLRQIHNAKAKIRSEEFGGRTVLQAFMSFIQENDYLQWTDHDPHTNVLTKLMFTHPTALKLLRVFPYVLVIDSTYKTNKYNMPLVEIIGCSSVGMNFTLAQAYVRREPEMDFAK